MIGFIARVSLNFHHLDAVLLHTLWQGLLLSLLCALLLRRIPVQRPNLRYGVAVAGLLGIVMAALITWCALVNIEDAQNPSPAKARIAQAATSLPPVAVASPAQQQGTLPELTITQPVAPLSVVLMWLWFAGVLLMLVRVLWLLRGTRVLYRNSMPTADPQMNELLEELSAALGISRRVSVRIGENLVMPMAMGLFWPVVLLPGAMATGLSPEQLRVVLAHELAHIRRYDYLVNFLQLVVEALLYFNPAVWWLSRQIRIEREACCDALAARVSGGPVDYAAALAVVARTLHSHGLVSGMAQAFGDQHRPDGLLDRTRRLLLPGYWPKLRLRGHSLILGLLFSAALLLGLYQSSRLSVACAGWFLSDTERIEVMTQLDTTLNPKLDYRAPEEYVEVSCRIITPDGKPLPESITHIGAISTYANGTSSSGLSLDGGTFRGRVSRGNIYLQVEIPGYAPASAGPLKGDAQHPIKDLEIRLEPSQPATIRFRDVEGRAVPNVHVIAGYNFLASTWRENISLTSDARGQVHLDQAMKPIPVSLEVSATGYEYASQRNLTIAPGATYDWLLQPETPIEGIVTDRGSGSPLFPAEVALLLTGDNPCSFLNNGKGDRLAFSDPEGRFVLHGLKKTQSYCLVVRYPDYGTENVLLNPTQEGPLKVSLAPRYVKGVIRGDLGLLEICKETGGPVIGSTTMLQIDGCIYPVDTRDTAVSVHGGVGTFQIKDLSAGPLTISAGPVNQSVTVDKPVEDLVINLDAPKKPMRKVTFHFTAPNGAPPATGTLKLYGDEMVLITDGVGETDLVVPGKIALNLSEFDLKGYLPTPNPKAPNNPWTWEIPEGSEPHAITIPLQRAGAVHGRVLLSDGFPAAEAEVSMMLLDRDNGSGKMDPFVNHLNSRRRCNAQGEFALLPLPLNKAMSITASLGLLQQTTRVKLTDWKSVEEVQLQFPKGTDVTVVVLKPDGLPMPGLKIWAKLPGGYKQEAGTTDSSGRALLQGVDLTKEYFAGVEPAAWFQPSYAPVNKDGREVVLRLQEGLHLEGSVLMADNKTPATNVSVRAAYATQTGMSFTFDYVARMITNSDGKFSFTNLRAGTYSLEIEWTQSTPLEIIAREGADKSIYHLVTAGQTEPIVLYVAPGNTGP